MKCQDQLAEIVHTPHACGGLTHVTDRREQKAYSDNNNSDDHNEFGTGKSVAS
jgi:hypothetical protein